MPEQKRAHALIIGGGIAGLLAARVVLTHFERVTVIERDHYPEGPSFRAGVPQGRHAHIMLLRGQQALEELFPGIKARLLAQGAVERTYGAEGVGASVYYYGARCPQIPPVLRGWNCSRPLLEWQIRQELTAADRLQVIEGAEVVHLTQADQAICGVRYRWRTPSLANEVQEQRADLVIDASGSSSRIACWLEELGFVAPQEETIQTCVNYATRVYRPDEANRCKEIAIQTMHPGRPAGAVMEVEGGRWVVSLTGVGKQHGPSTTEEEFLDFARRLPEPTLYEVLCHASPLSPVYGYRKVENRRRHFPHLPAGLIVLGDSLCSLNPLYGQGMTIAALEALLLDRCLRISHGKDVSRRFQKRAAHLLLFPWHLAATADAAAHATIGESQPGGLRYIEDLIALLPHDQKALLTFLEVLHMVRSPLALLHPFLFGKVIVHTWRKGKKEM